VFLKLRHHNYGFVRVNFDLVTDYLRFDNQSHTNINLLSPTNEGGWKVIAVDETPEEIDEMLEALRAGQSHTFGYRRINPDQ
jgi:hypothetical protein